MPLLIVVVMGADAIAMEWGTNVGDGHRRHLTADDVGHRVGASEGRYAGGRKGGMAGAAWWRKQRRQRNKT
jgi:hypothetical protein